MRIIIVLLTLALSACAYIDRHAVEECQSICTKRSEQMVRCERATLAAAQAAKAECIRVNTCEWLTSSLFPQGYCGSCCEDSLADTCDPKPYNCQNRMWLPPP